MKRYILGLALSLTLINCKEISSREEQPESPAIEENNTTPEPSAKSVIEMAYNIPMKDKESASNGFVCLLPNGRFVRGYHEYKDGTTYYYQLNESQYTGTYKIIGDNLIESNQTYKGEYGGNYKTRYQLKIVDAIFGEKAFELRALNKNGNPTHEESEWFWSAFISVAEKLNF
jgi:hypothetical protein